MNRRWVQVGSILAFLSVAFGAFGAHALKARLSPEELAIWETGARYQFFHALALIFLGLADKVAGPNAINRIGMLFTVGVIIFSGSLYAIALTGIQRFGAITPLGGVCFLAGWAYLCFACSKSQTIG